jgi:hypothetical protein
VRGTPDKTLCSSVALHELASGVEENPREPRKKRTDQILLLTFPGRTQKMFEYRLLDECS